MHANRRNRMTAYFAAMTAVAVGVFGCGRKNSSPEEQFEPKFHWTAPSELEGDTILHDELPSELLARIKNVHATFADVHGQPLAELIDELKREPEPESNVRIWEDMQIAYNSYCNDHEVPLETRKEVFKIVAWRAALPDTEVLAKLKLQNVPANDVKAILAAYPSEPKPLASIPAGRQLPQDK